MLPHLDIQTFSAVAAIGSFIIAFIKLNSERKKNVLNRKKLAEKDQKIIDLENAIY